MRPSGSRVLVVIAIFGFPAASQQPAIAPKGVVNAASYVAPPTVDHALTGASLATIFGQNLASGTFTADPPYPRILGGTIVSFGGVAAPLQYVSPTQINFQVPTTFSTVSVSSPLSSPLYGYAQVPVAVSTGTGTSAPVSVDLNGVSPGIFTQDSSGCGSGAIINVDSQGNTSANSEQNSANPGDYLEIFGTGSDYRPITM
jgi:uncharacterized protein (TIGR03437 family)